MRRGRAIFWAMLFCFYGILGVRFANVFRTLHDWQGVEQRMERERPREHPPTWVPDYLDGHLVYHGWIIIRVHSR